MELTIAEKQAHLRYHITMQYLNDLVPILQDTNLNKEELVQNIRNMGNTLIKALDMTNDIDLLSKIEIGKKESHLHLVN
jgi:hypothetical protein